MLLLNHDRYYIAIPNWQNYNDLFLEIGICKAQKEPLVYFVRTAFFDIYLVFAVKFWEVAYISSARQRAK